MKELFGCALTNVVFLALGLVLLYWTICRELPDVLRLDNTLVKLNVQMDEARLAADTCHAALLQWERSVAQELCMPVGIDAALLVINAWLLLHYHRRWARYLIVLMAVMFAVDMPAKLYDATFPAPEIHKVDPTFAMVDEELLIALDGKNLKPGGSVAWVAYWGCATTSNVDACEKQFVSTFEAGNVPVTFTSLDHFIPCYRDPPNPLKAQEYQCFEDVRIRVKDKQSIPGWSRSGPQAARAARSEALLGDEWQEGLEVPGFKHEDMTKPTHSRHIASSAVSIDAVDIDRSVSTLSPDSLSTEHYERSEFIKEAVELSADDVRENLSQEAQAESSLPSVLEAEIAAETVKEVEVTSKAEVRVLHADIAPDDAAPDEVDVSPNEPEEVCASSDSQEDVRASETEKQANTIQPRNAQESEAHVIDENEMAFGAAELTPATVDYRDIKPSPMSVVVEEEDLSTTTVIIDEERGQISLGSQEVQDLEIEVVDRVAGASKYEAHVDEVRMSEASVQMQETETQLFSEEATAFDDTATPAEETPSKQRKRSKHKGQRIKKSSGSTAAAV
jgi:hypothetical protein